MIARAGVYEYIRYIWVQGTWKLISNNNILLFSEYIKQVPIYDCKLNHLNHLRIDVRSLFRICS